MKLLKKHCKTIRIFLLFIVFSIIFSLGYSFSWIQGDSMSPTYHDKEWVVIDEWTYRFFMPEEGDVIIVRDPSNNDTLIKRIIATPGQKVEVKEGYIYVDGIALSDKFKEERILIVLVDENDTPLRYWGDTEINEIVVEYTSHLPEKLGKDEYWVIGDNRESSWYGVVKFKDIKGKLRF